MAVFSVATKRLLQTTTLTLKQKIARPRNVSTLSVYRFTRIPFQFQGNHELMHCNPKPFLFAHHEKFGAYQQRETSTTQRQLLDSQPRRQASGRDTIVVDGQKEAHPEVYEHLLGTWV